MEHFSLADLNIWAILVASILNMFIGFLWYSRALFGVQWMNSLGFKEEDLNPSPGLFIGAYLLGLLILSEGKSLKQDGPNVKQPMLIGILKTT